MRGEQSDQQKAIDAALTAAQGHRETAAEALGLNVDALANKINNSPALKLKWGQPKRIEAPSTEQTLARESPVPPAPLEEPPFANGEMQLAVSIAKEDAKYKKGLNAVGFNDRQMAYAESLQKHIGRHFRCVAEMALGALSKSIIEQSMLISQLVETIKAGFKNDNPILALEQEALAWKNYHLAVENLNRSAATTQESLIINAKIALWREQLKANKDRPKHGRPGFQPLGQTVHET